MFCLMVYLNNTKLTHLFVRRYFQLCWVRRVPLQDFVFLLSPWMFSRTPSGLMQGHFRIVQWFIYNHSWVLLAVSPCLALTVLGCCPVGPMTCIWGRAFWHWAACFPPESLDTFDFSLCSAHARKQTQLNNQAYSDFWSRYNVLLLVRELVCPKDVITETSPLVNMHFSNYRRGRKHLVWNITIIIILSEGTNKYVKTMLYLGNKQWRVSRVDRDKCFSITL